MYLDYRYKTDGQGSHILQRQRRESKRDLTPVKPVGLRQGLNVSIYLETYGKKKKEKKKKTWESEQGRENSHQGVAVVWEK